MKELAEQGRINSKLSERIRLLRQRCLDNNIDISDIK